MEILYYSDNRLDGTYLDQVVQEHILKAGLPVTSVTLKPKDFGRNIVYFKKRGHRTLYEQILLGLVNMKSEYVFFCEHDVLYHPSHFDFKPERDDVYYYDGNIYKFRTTDKKMITYDCKWLSQMCVNREHAIRHYRKRLDMIEQGKKAWGYEPGTGQSRIIDRYKSENWFSEYPCLDIRHGKNVTGVQRMHPSEFKNKQNCQNWKEQDYKELTYWKDICEKL